MSDTMKRWLPRICIGGAGGLSGALVFGYLCSPGLLFGSSFVAFTFYVGSVFPQGLGALLSVVLFILFGAQVGVATLPFDDRGWALAAKSAAHFLAMAATVGAFAWLNFGLVEVPWFLVRLAAVYALVWGVRWLGWYFELGAIKKKLGL